jgi:hypothetical protein
VTYFGGNWMIKNGMRILFYLTVVIFVCSLLGCTKWPGNRIYPGQPRPFNEVALVYCDLGTSITSIFEKGNNKNLISGFHLQLELLPGEYTAFIEFQTNLGKHLMKGRTYSLKLNLQGGNIYLIYPKIPNFTTWEPIFVNINQYKKEDCMENYLAYGKLECKDVETIQEWAGLYLRGERRMNEPPNNKH